MLSGAISQHDREVWSTVISRLPDDCRPSAHLVFGSNALMNNARLDLLPDGTLTYVFGGNMTRNNLLSLTGVVFVVKNGVMDIL